jgi:hypothetical protein
LVTLEGRKWGRARDATTEHRDLVAGGRERGRALLSDPFHAGEAKGRVTMAHKQDSHGELELLPTSTRTLDARKRRNCLRWEGLVVGSDPLARDLRDTPKGGVKAPKIELLSFESQLVAQVQPVVEY